MSAAAATPSFRGAVRRRLAARARRSMSAAAIAALYDDFFGAVCRAQGLDATAARAALAPYARRRLPNVMPGMAAAARARRLALYLLNVELDVPQCALAHVVVMTREGVSAALRQAELERDDRAYDALVERVARDVLGVRP